VEGWSIGDRVVSETAFAYCGVCLHCRDGFYNLCSQRRTLGYWFDGAFAPYTIVPAARLHGLPAELSFLEGALMEPLACVTHSVLELTSILPTDWVLVSGPGAVGLAALQVAKAQGARVVVAGTSVDAERMKKAISLGADLTVDVQKENLLDILKDITGGLGVDVALECSGSARALESAILGVRKRGQLTQIGLYGKPITVDFEKICFKEIKVTGSLGSRWKSWESALNLTKSKKVLLEPLVSHVMPLSDWKKAFEMFERKEGLKLVLDPKK
jgi:L-iditol 2-dehydrogenase